MTYSFILLAGGSGTRMKKSVPKQYLLLAGKPMIMHVIERVDRLEGISELIIVCEAEYVQSIQLMLAQYAIRVPVVFAEAGASRQESVKSGLAVAKEENVMIHEAARPFVSEDDFRCLMDAPGENVIFGQGITFTVLRGHEYVEGIEDRPELVNVQLPQKFSKKLLLKAHEMAARDKRSFTEDASLLHCYEPEIRIRIVPGPEYNIKITTPMDLVMGGCIYKEYFSGRK